MSEPDINTHQGLADIAISIYTTSGRGNNGEVLSTYEIMSILALEAFNLGKKESEKED